MLLGEYLARREGVDTVMLAVLVVRKMIEMTYDCCYEVKRNLDWIGRKNICKINNKKSLTQRQSYS